MSDPKSELLSDTASRTSEDEGPLTGWLDRSLSVMCAIFLAAIVSVLSLQVVMRYVIENPLIWADEAARLLMVWLTFTGAALAYRTRSHIAITLLVDTLLAKHRQGAAARTLQLVVEAVVVIAATSLMIGGVIILIRTTGHATPALELPIAALFLPAPLSGAIVLGTAVQRSFSRISVRRNGGHS